MRRVSSSGTAFHGGGQFGLLSQSPDSLSCLSLSCLIKIKELSIFPISSSEDRYGHSGVLVSARVLPHPLSSAALLALSSAITFTSRQETHSAGPPLSQAPHST